MSWLKDRFNELTAQVNPFDGGKSAVTVRRARPQAPAQTKTPTVRPFQSVLGTGRNQSKLDEDFRRSEQYAQDVAMKQANLQRQRGQINKQQFSNKVNQATNTPIQRAIINNDLRNGRARNGVSDFFDSDSAMDRMNRVQQGQPEMYRAQQQAMGNSRPYESLGAQLAGNTMRFANTAKYARDAAGESIVGQVADWTNNQQALQNSLDRQRAIRQRNGAASGIGGVGTIFNDENEMMNLGVAELAKRQALNTIGTASEIIPLARVARPVQGGIALTRGSAPTTSRLIQAANSAERGTSGLRNRVVFNGAVDATTGAMESAARQYAQTGRIDPTVLAGDVIANTVMGQAQVQGSRLLNSAPGKKTIDTAKAVNAKVQQLDPAVRRLDETYNQLRKRYDTASPQLRKQIVKALEANRAERAARTKVGIGNSVAGRQATGYDKAVEQGLIFDGVDGKPRFEVDDSGAKFNSDKLDEISAQGIPARLSDVFDHPKLFEQYPELKNTYIAKSNTGKRNAEYDPNRNVILLDKDVKDSGTVLHEIQHAIQETEGFAKGGNLGTVAGFSPEEAAQINQVRSLVEQVKDSATPLFDINRSNAPQPVKDWAMNLIRGGDEAIADFNKNTPFEQYRNLAGEAEARAVEARRNMPMSERYKRADDTVYHGTKNQFERFSSDKLGSNTGAKSSKEGFFFTDNQDNANAYTKMTFNEDKITEAIFNDKNLLYETPWSSTQLGFSAVTDALSFEGSGKDAVLKNVSKRFDEQIAKARADAKGNAWEKELNAKLDKIEAYKPGLMKIWEKNYTSSSKLPHIKQVQLDYKNPYVLTEDKGYKAGEYTKVVAKDGKAFKSYTDAIKYAKENGYDAVKIQDAKDPLPGNTTVVFNENQIRQAKPRSTFYDSLDVPKEDLIIRNGDDKAMSIEPKLTPDGLKSKVLAANQISVQLENLARSKRISITPEDVAKANKLDDLNLKLHYEQDSSVIPQIDKLSAELSNKYLKNKATKVAPQPTKGATAPTSTKTAKPSPKKAPQDTPQPPQATSVSPQKQIVAELESLAKPKTPLKRIMPETKSATGSFDANSTTKQIKVKGAISDADYLKRYGKDRAGKKVKVNPFEVESYAFNRWKDKSTLGLGRETLERNLDTVAGKDAPRIKKFLVDASRDNEAARADFLTNTRSRIRKDIVEGLGIRAKSKESNLVQKYGEGIIDDKQLKELAGDKANNIKKASEYFRKEYDDLLNAWNSKRAIHNLDPVPKRQDYFRHFQEISDGISQIGVIMNQSELPTSISGLTDMFKPNKPFSTAELRRLGNKTDFDAVGGMDNYLDSVSRQIFHTDTVQRGRSIENAIRKQADANPEILLPNFVANLSEWTNIVSGKKTKVDRASEALVGRKIYGLANWARRRTGANMVGANLASAVTNFIPFTQSLSTTQKVPAVKGMMNALTSPFSKSGNEIGGVKSSFLTRRFADGAIDARGVRRASEVASTPFRLVDQFTSRSIVGGKYFEGLEKGLTPQQAMKAADEYAGKVIGDRSIGQTPNIFNSQTLGFVTQFQLEVNNQISFLMKDIPALANGDKKKIASSLVQFVAFSYMFNEAYEQITGRRPQIDVIQTALDVKGNPDEESNLTERIGKASKNITTGLPGVSVFTGGRLPVNAMLPNGGEIIKGVQNIGNTEGKPVGSHIYKGLSGPLFYGLPPFGGGQVKKTVEGLQAVSKGESTSASGKKRFDVSNNPLNTAKAAVFGQYATNEGKAYIDKLENSKAGIKTKDQQEKLRDLTGQAKKDYEKQIASGNVSDKGAVKVDKDDVGGKIAQKMEEYRAKLPKNLPKDMADELVRYNRLTADGRDNYYKNLDKKLSLEVAQYKKDRLSGKLTNSEAFKREKDIKKLSVATKYGEEAHEAYSLALYEIKQLTKDNPELMKKLRAYDKELYDQGLISRRKFGGSSSGGRSGGRRSGGSKASKYDYTKNLFANNTSSTSVTDSLRSILERAMKA